MPPGSGGWLEQPAARYAEPVLRDLSLRDALRDAVPPPELVAALAGRYAIERVIGSGSMATVYLARDLRFDRAVAIKVLRPELERDCDVRHFRREIVRTAQINHPHIVPVFDASNPGEPPFYVMPYMEGGTLRQRLAHERRLALSTAVAITRLVAQALECAHGYGLVHRDVKPEHLLFTAGQAAAPAGRATGAARGVPRPARGDRAGHPSRPRQIARRPSRHGGGLRRRAGGLNGLPSGFGRAPG
jgi:hypothetical protein